MMLAKITTESAKNVIYKAQQKVQDTTDTLNPQKILVFILCMGTSILFISLSFMFLPIIVVSPHKFAILFTFGSFFFMAGFAVMKGFSGFLKYMVERERLPFSFVYISSLSLTLYATIFLKSYLLTLLFSIVQIIALVSFLITNFPGGYSALNYLTNNIFSSIKSRLAFSTNKNTPLPI
ncbi:SFT2 family protein [Cryptosporidium felis]|nr:SFT2 family protein [Cryptosporidium felis]